MHQHCRPIVSKSRSDSWHRTIALTLTLILLTLLTVSDILLLVHKNTPFVIGNKLSAVPVMMSLISYLSLDMVSHYVNPHISTQHRASVLLLLQLLSVRAGVLSCPFCRRYWYICWLYTHFLTPSVLRHCWLGVMKSMRPVKIKWWGVGVVICLERGVDCLYMVQLMPLHPKTPSCLASFKSRLVLPFWYRITQVVLEKRLSCP